MLGEHHSLLKEFLEHKDVISRLLKDDKHFSSLAGQYHELDNRIVDVEEQGVPIGDTEFTVLKKRRAALKDELYACILNAQ